MNRTPAQVGKPASPSGGVARIGGWTRAIDRVVDGLDFILDIAVASLAIWTLVYGALLLGNELPVGFVAWLLLTAGLIVLRVRRPWLHRPRSTSIVGTVGALGITFGSGALASVISRPDGDDAWYLLQSVWVAEHGAIGTRDILFTDERWAATIGAVPSLSSIEALFGAVARYSAVPTGDVVYRYFVPVAAIAAVWGLWGLLRAWGARRATWSLALAMAFIILGGYAHGTWGNMHLARIWQGKAVLLAVLVPYIYTVVASVVRTYVKGGPNAGRTPRALLLAGAGIAAVGASSTGVFVVPLIAAAASAGLAWNRRWVDALLVGSTLSCGPLAAGVVTLLSPAGTPNEMGRASGSPWHIALVTAPMFAVAAIAVSALLLGAVAPQWWGTIDRTVQRPLLVTIVIGCLFTVPPFYGVLTTVMGGDAIAHRLAWVIPVPALVGLIASLPARRGAPLIPIALVTAGLIGASGTPLWAVSNGAHLAAPGTWKVRDPVDLAVARWIVAQEPAGRYLAGNWVTFLVGAITTDLAPVGSRTDYLGGIQHLPDGQFEERLVLQQFADGPDSRTPANRDLVIGALDVLDVSIACVVWNDAYADDVMTSAGFTPVHAQGPWTCWTAK